MVIVTAAKTDGIGVSEDEEGHKIIASRIEVLVQEGRLAAKGDLKNGATVRFGFREGGNQPAAGTGRRDGAQLTIRRSLARRQ